MTSRHPPVQDWATDFDDTGPAWVADPYPIWADPEEWLARYPDFELAAPRPSPGPAAGSADRAPFPSGSFRLPTTAPYSARTSPSPATPRPQSLPLRK
jgi:hypothetical protein